MPAIRKITAEAIVDAAVAVLRESGFAAVNARSVAKKLGCSTQPIYLSFRSMTDLKSALTARAIDAHIARVRELLRARAGLDARYTSYGMGLVRFAEQEKPLFRWLYLESGSFGPEQEDVLLPEILAVMVEDYGYSKSVARAFHQDMARYAYGLAFLANAGHLHLDDDGLRAALRREFIALTGIYGWPPRIPPEIQEETNV